MLTRTNIPYLDFTWNPGGFGCSKKCSGCWAHWLAPRIGHNIGCEKCKKFEVHWHPERLDDPLRRKKPAVIGVEFTGELFDIRREDKHLAAVGRTIVEAHWHDYVFLTSQPNLLWRAILADRTETGTASWIKHQYLGYTLPTQDAVDRYFQTILIREEQSWLSLEPMRGPIDLVESPGWRGLRLMGAKLGDYLEGVIVGCDKRPKIPWSNSWARQIVRQCREHGVRVFVKQLRDFKTGRLLTDPNDFPKDLQVRELPWRLTTK
jgi:protein gp37